MDPLFFVKGLIVGFSIAAPVGPIGILCIRRTLTEGRLMGLVSGLGAATADALYGCVAGFGLTLISSLLIRFETWVHLLGGIFLFYLGIRIFQSKPQESSTAESRKGLWRAYGTTFFLTLTNPMTILAFAAIFTGLEVTHESQNYAAAVILVSGVFLGSTLWWIILSNGIGFFRKWVNPLTFKWINRISALLILGFGLISILSLK